MLAQKQAARPRPRSAKIIPRGMSTLETRAVQAVADHDAEFGKALRGVERFEYAALTRIYAFGLSLNETAWNAFLRRHRIIESGHYKFPWSPIIDAFYRPTKYIERSQRSRYGKALSFAAVKNIEPPGLPRFIRNNGGVKGIDELPWEDQTGQTEQKLVREQRRMDDLAARMGAPKTAPIEAPELTAGRAPGPCVFVGAITDDGRVVLHRVPDLDEPATTRFILRQVQP